MATSAAAGVSVAAIVISATATVTFAAAATAVVSGIHQALADQNPYGHKTEVAAVMAVSKN